MSTNMCIVVKRRNFMPTKLNDFTLTLYRCNKQILNMNIFSQATKKPMPFFQNAAETDVDAFGRKKVPPPVARKPRASSGFEDEDGFNGVVSADDILAAE